MSVCLYVRMKPLGSHWEDFYAIWNLGFFENLSRKIQVLLKSDTNNIILYMKACVYLWWYLAELFWIWDRFPKKVTEKIKHILYRIKFSENHAAYNLTWKYMVEPDRSEMKYNQAHAPCVLDN
jgi:hypothetical protein